MTRSLSQQFRGSDDAGSSTRWIPNLLTLALVVPCGAMAVLFTLEIDVLANHEARRLAAAGAALIVPVALFALRGIEALYPAWSRAFSGLAGLIWFLVATGLVSIPLSARMGLGSRAGGSATGRAVRDLHVPESSEFALSIAAGLSVAVPFALLGLAAARAGPAVTVLVTLLTVGVGLATVPVSFYGIAMSYDLPVGVGDDRLVDTAQSMAIVWLVPAPMAALLAGVTIAHAIPWRSRESGE